MTPIIDFILANAEGIARDWDPQVLGITSGRGLVQAITEAAIYLIPEAETDTTAAAEMDPAYYTTNAGARMTWPVMWIEYRAYVGGDDYVGDSAYLLVAQGDLMMCFGTSLIRSMFLKPLPFFGWPLSEMGRSDRGVGKPYRLHPAPNVEPDKAAKACDFVRELLSFINAPTGVVDTVKPPSGRDMRRARGILGPAAVLPPYHVLRADGGMVSASSVALRAAKAMGSAPSEAMN